MEERGRGRGWDGVREEVLLRLDDDRRGLVSRGRVCSSVSTSLREWGPDARVCAGWLECLVILGWL